MEQLRTFSEVIEHTIASLEANPEDTARQLAIVRGEVIANNHDLANRLRRDPEDAGVEEALAAEARVMLAAAGTLLLETLGWERYEEGKMCARGVGMLDEMARSVREDDADVAQALRSEIETALEDFAKA